MSPLFHLGNKSARPVSTLLAPCDLRHECSQGLVPPSPCLSEVSLSPCRRGTALIEVPGPSFSATMPAFYSPGTVQAAHPIVAQPEPTHRLRLRPASIRDALGRSCMREVDLGLEHLVDVVCQHVRCHVQHDLNGLRIGVAGCAQGRDVGLRHISAGHRDFAGESDRCVGTGIGRPAFSVGRDLRFFELVALGEGCVSCVAVVAAIDVRDRQSDPGSGHRTGTDIR